MGGLEHLEDWRIGRAWKQGSEASPQFAFPADSQRVILQQSGNAVGLLVCGNG